MSQYESAISSCIELIRYYQSNQMVPMYGIGARLPPSFSHHSNCFALSGDWYDPEIDLRDIENAIHVFKTIFKRNKPSSSLVFSDMLKFANQYCKEEEFNTQNQTLCILLIFSHNELLESDIDQTIYELSQFVEVPFQVVNIGIGNQKFEYIKTLLSEENYECSKKFSFIPYEHFKNDQVGFCTEIFKNIPKSFLERARNQRIPPLKSFDKFKLFQFNQSMLSAREYYQNNSMIGQKKNFACINERPFFDYLTVELGYKIDLIKDIFGNGLEEEDVGLVLDRIGMYSKPANSQANSRFYNSKRNEQSVPEVMIQKVKQFYRLREKYNSHTKKIESKRLAIKKQNADNLSPFSFFYKGDQKNEKQYQINQQQSDINLNRLPPNYPETYQNTRINSTNDLQASEIELNPSYGANSIYNGYRSDNIENNLSFNSSPYKQQNSGLLQDSPLKKPLRQNNFMNKWKDAVVQSAKMNNQPMRIDKKNKPVIQGINCPFCPCDQIQIILMPCGHNCCCQEYLDQYSNQACPICNQHITQIVRFYDNEQTNDYYQSEGESKRSKSKDKVNISTEIKDLIQNEPFIEYYVDKNEISNQISQKKREKYYQNKNGSHSEIELELNQNKEQKVKKQQ